MWGALETFVEDFIVKILLENPKALENTEFSRIKIPLVDFALLDQEDKMRFLVNELRTNLRVEFKPGVDKFEPLLAIFDLAGPVDKTVKRDLYEFYHVRNVIVHRASIADRRLLRACPWLSYSPGDPIRIDRKLYQRYIRALTAYMVTIIRRITSSLKNTQQGAPKNKRRRKESVRANA